MTLDSTVEAFCWLSLDKGLFFSDIFLMSALVLWLLKDYGGQMSLQYIVSSVYAPTLGVNLDQLVRRLLRLLSPFHIALDTVVLTL